LKWRGLPPIKQMPFCWLVALGGTHWMKKESGGVPYVACSSLIVPPFICVVRNARAHQRRRTIHPLSMGLHRRDLFGAQHVRCVAFCGGIPYCIPAHQTLSIQLAVSRSYFDPDLVNRFRKLVKKRQGLIAGDANSVAIAIHDLYFILNNIYFHVHVVPSFRLKPLASPSDAVGFLFVFPQCHESCEHLPELPPRPFAEIAVFAQRPRPAVCAELKEPPLELIKARAANPSPTLAHCSSSLPISGVAELGGTNPSNSLF
jgi:hypothetical protein